MLLKINFLGLIVGLLFIFFNCGVETDTNTKYKYINQYITNDNNITNTITNYFTNKNIYSVLNLDLELSNLYKKYDFSTNQYFKFHYGYIYKDYYLYYFNTSNVVAIHSNRVDVIESLYSNTYNDIAYTNVETNVNNWGITNYYTNTGYYSSNYIYTNYDNFSNGNLYLYTNVIIKISLFLLTNANINGDYYGSHLVYDIEKKFPINKGSFTYKNVNEYDSHHKYNYDKNNSDYYYVNFKSSESE